MRAYFLAVLLAVLGVGAAVAAGCSSSRHRVGNNAMLVANADRPHAACLRHCRQIGRYDVALEACERACNDARKDFPYLDTGYSSYERCARDMDNLDLERLDIVAEAQAECERTYDHLHKRYGCKEGFAAYYNAATIENVCGGYVARVVAPQTAQTPRVNAPMTRVSGPQTAPLAPVPAYLPVPAVVPAKPISPAAAASGSSSRPVAAPSKVSVPSSRVPAFSPKASAPSSRAAAPALKAPSPSTKLPAKPAPSKRGTIRPGAPTPVTVKGSPSAYGGKKGTSVAPAPKSAPLPTAKPGNPARVQPTPAVRPDPAQPVAPPSAPMIAPVPAPAPASAAPPAPQSTPNPASVPASAPTAPPVPAPAPQPTREPAPPPVQTSAPLLNSTGAPAPGLVSTPTAAPAPAPTSTSTQNGAPAQRSSQPSIVPPLPSMLKQKESIPATMPPSAQ